VLLGGEGEGTRTLEECADVVVLGAFGAACGGTWMCVAGGVVFRARWDSGVVV
jgi:hypothetical protein